MFLGRDIAQARDYSDDTAKQIDVGVRQFVDEGYKSAYEILEANADIMHRMATALLERETLDKVEIDLLIAGQEQPPFKSPLAFADPATRRTEGGQARSRPQARLPGRRPTPA